MSSSPPLLELRKVTKTYREGRRERDVLRDADLAIAPGERVVLLGRSGSGKSTLLNLLSGIDLPSAGQILLDGTDFGALSEHQRTLLRRHQIGFVFQFFNLLPTLTVEENLLLPLELAGRLGAAERARALELLEVVGLADRRASFPDVLSGGEQQRVAIARSLINDPSIIFADEPTGNLDTKSGGEVMNLLMTLAGEKERTLLVVTHDMELAETGDRKVMIVDGKIEE